MAIFNSYVSLPEGITLGYSWHITMAQLFSPGDPDRLLQQTTGSAISQQSTSSTYKNPVGYHHFLHVLWISEKQTHVSHEKNTYMHIYPIPWYWLRTSFSQEMKLGITPYCGRLRNPAPPKGWLKPKQNNRINMDKLNHDKPSTSWCRISFIRCMITNQLAGSGAGGVLSLDGAILSAVWGYQWETK